MRKVGAAILGIIFGLMLTIGIYVYLVEAGKEDAVCIARAKPDKVSYSLPVAWP